jgi:glycosyltransferase involved in cell wall biosynthesis
MRTYDKRIAFLISDQHFIPHGGIGQFAKGFTEMCGRIGWKVDIVLDKQPTNDFSEIVKSLGANIVYPPESLKYSDHTATFAFSDTINFEKIVNFRKAILHAFQENIYDMIVCNTQESMSAAYAMTVHKYIPVVFYTHLHSMIFRESQGSDVFLDSYHNFYNKHMEFDDIVIGTQSQKNVRELNKHSVKNAVVLGLPMTERGLFEPYMGDRRGVLFIGRWEEGKNPEAYIKVMKECGLPCKVMTNANGAKKFEKAFKEAGITDYEIKASIIGQEKVDFIKSCRVHFNPSHRESYGIAFMECLGHLSCVVLDTQDWSYNFADEHYTMTDMDHAHQIIELVYQSTPEEYYSTGALEYVKSLDATTQVGWVDFLNNFKSHQSKTNAAKINEYETVKYSDYINDLNRTHLAREDFESVLSNRHKFKVIYTDRNTYLTKDANFTPTEETAGVSLFEGL